jgi:hypothetical protein
MWSYGATTDNHGEVYLGNSSSFSFRVPAGITGPMTLTFFLSGLGGKISKKYYLSGGAGINAPPIVELGGDTAVIAGDSLRISGSIIDDALSGQQLTYHWSIIHGSADLSDTAGSLTTLSFSQPGLVVLRLSVNDGELEAFDNRNIIVGATGFFRFVWPDVTTVCQPGDELMVRWLSAGADDACLSFSYDNGRTFSDRVPIVRASDPAWGTYLWQIPSDAPETVTAILRLSSYNNEVSSTSFPFVITAAPAKQQ